MSFERLLGAAERAIERFSSSSGGAALEAARQRAEQAQAELYDGSVPPWQTLSEQFAILEEELKARILALSAQQSIFTTAAAEQHRAATRHRSVLPGCLPMATAALEADPQLAQLRFRLVPRRLSEEDFWQVRRGLVLLCAERLNYFWTRPRGPCRCTFGTWPPPSSTCATTLRAPTPPSATTSGSRRRAGHRLGRQRLRRLARASATRWAAAVAARSPAKAAREQTPQRARSLGSTWRRASTAFAPLLGPAGTQRVPPLPRSSTRSSSDSSAVGVPRHTPRTSTRRLTRRRQTQRRRLQKTRDTALAHV